MIKTELVALCQSKANEQRAREYCAHVRKLRKQKRIRKAVVGILATAFFVGAFGLVGKSDLETERVVLAKESKTETTLTRNGEIRFKDLIETEEGYLWKADADYPKETQVSVLFDTKGTESPLDDVILGVTERR